MEQFFFLHRKALKRQFVNLIDKCFCRVDASFGNYVKRTSTWVSVSFSTIVDKCCWYTSLTCCQVFRLKTPKLRRANINYCHRWNFSLKLVLFWFIGFVTFGNFCRFHRFWFQRPWDGEKLSNEILISLQLFINVLKPLHIFSCRSLAQLCFAV